MAIHIKKKNVGKFTAYKKRTGKTTAEALHSKDPHVRKMANFARNAKKWKHPFGGLIGPDGPTFGDPNSTSVVTNNLWTPQTRSSIYPLLAQKGLLGHGADSVTMQQWNKLTPQQTLPYMQQDQGFDWTQGNTANPGGIKYWNLDKVPAVNGKSIRSSQFSDRYFKEKKNTRYPMGGLIQPYALGGAINAEVEKQEVVVPPNGIQAGIRRKYNLPTHKNATADNLISAQPGSFVVSDRLMYDEDRTMAQAYEEAGKKADRYQKILDNPKSTTLAIKTSQRNLDNIKRTQQDIIAKNQAMLGGQQNNGEFAEGGFLSAAMFAANPAIGAAMSLAPVAANLIEGLSPAEKLNPNDYMNPYAGQAMGLMSNRRFNTGPALAANANAAAAAMGNVVNQGGGRGQVNANRQALLSTRMMGDASVNAQAQNANNEYLGQEAQFKAGIGQQMANTRMQIKDINDKNKAAKMAMLNTAMGQLGQFGQTQTLMGNQANRDKDMMARWQDYLDMMMGSGKGRSNQQLNPAGYTD
jgi:hypothetical protein